MVDACMRALMAAGWLDFRMRAMLMSFASYHLWLDWRASAHLAHELPIMNRVFITVRCKCNPAQLASMPFGFIT